MPELPEVQTTVNGLKKKVLNRTFVDVWSDWKKMVRLRSDFNRATARQIKNPNNFELFKKELKGKKILKIWRRAKNVIFDLSGSYSLLIHQKMTGHLMVGAWNKEGNAWKPTKRGPLDEKVNTFLHIIFFLDNGQMIALSDVRKFAKVELWKTDELLEDFKTLGSEPLEKSFTFEKFKERLKNKKGKIKMVIMDPKVIVGIGNIYSSEALWRAKIHPAKDVSKLSEKELKRLYDFIREVLLSGIHFGGDSFSDYRNVDGKPGNFAADRKVYKQEGKKCFKCKMQIKRLVLGGRSAFFCPKCQRK